MKKLKLNKKIEDFLKKKNVSVVTREIVRNMHYGLVRLRLHNRCEIEIVCLDNHLFDIYVYSPIKGYYDFVFKKRIYYGELCFDRLCEKILKYNSYSKLQISLLGYKVYIQEHLESKERQECYDNIPF